MIRAPALDRFNPSQPGTRGMKLAATGLLVVMAGIFIAARTFVLVDYDIRAELVDRACAITPGVESPTVSPLHDQGWVAVRAMVPKREVHRIMVDLYELGGRGIIVTDIHACRL